MSNGTLTGGKTALQSLTIKAIVAGMLTRVGLAVGLDLGVDDLDQLVIWGTLILSLIPDVIAWYGRVRARTRIVDADQLPPSAYSLGWASIGGAALMLLAASGGCAKVDADAARFAAMQQPVAEFKENHPEQAQSYSDLMAAWEWSIGERRKLAGGD